MSAYGNHLASPVEERAAELEAENKELKLRVEWLEAVNLLSQFVSGTPEFGNGTHVHIFKKIVNLIDRLFAVQNSFIAEYDPSGKQLTILAHSGQTDRIADLPASLVTFPEAVQIELEKRSPLTISSDQLDPMKESMGAGPYGAYLQVTNPQCLTLVPIQLGAQTFGILGLEQQEASKTLSSEELKHLSVFSTDIARLIEGTRLFEQAKSLIAQEERNRLARDLHDSVTQVLFSAALVAEVLPQIWRRDPDRAMRSLEKLQRLTRGALAEMRTMLLELRPAAVNKIPLSELLAQLTEAVTSRSGLPFQLFIEQTPPLPEEVHLNFYRVAQEALNNVVKHSQAQHVSVSLITTPLPPDKNDLPHFEVKLVIRDDGVGYYAEGEQISRLGLNIMRERAAAIQATLSLESEPGYGTLVSFNLDWGIGIGRSMMPDNKFVEKPIRILIVDDHPMVRSGLQDFILANEGLELVGEAQNGVEAVDFCANHEVDVILMDLVMPLMDGSEATRRIIAQGKPVKVIALTSFHEQNLVEQALKAGATSYLLKNVSAGELVEAIRAAWGGFSILAPEATEALIGSRRQRPDLGSDLTEKERQILPFLVKGLSNQEISTQLSISVATVKFHLNNIFTKLGARNRVEAATIALEHHLIEKV